MPKLGTTTTTPNKLVAFPQPSVDGNYLAFLSQASDLLAGFVDHNESPSPNQNDLFIRDMTTGVVTLISHKLGSTVEGGNGPMGGGPRISDDGGYVIFYSSSTDLVATGGGTQRPYLYDRVNGTTILLAQVQASAVAISGDGNWLGFYTADNVPKNIYDGAQGNYTGPGGGLNNIYVINRVSGAVTLATHVAGAPTTPVSQSAQSLITNSDGRYWAFELGGSIAGWDPPSSGTYAGEASYVWDRVTDTYKLMTKRNDGAAASTTVTNPTMVAITPDGRYVFFSHADIDFGTASTDNNAIADLYRYDQQGGSSKLSRYFFDVINIAPNAVTAQGEFSSNGRYFVFSSLASNIAGGDTNTRSDVFRLDTNDSSVVYCSAKADGTPWNTTDNGATFASVTAQALNSGNVFFTTTATGIGFTDTNGAVSDIVLATFAAAAAPIIVTNPATTTGTAGTAFSQTFTQTGAVGTATFALDTGTLPTGLSLSTAGVLNGTPTQTGTFPITVKVTDTASTVGTGATYTLVISCQTISVTNPGTTTGTTGTAFSQTFTQSGGIGSTTFSTVSTLPTGITLSSAGVLSGTPTQTGTFPIVVKATDSNACQGTGASYSLVISCPTVTVTNPGTTTGTAGTAFSQTFTQSGGAAPITFTLNSGSLPTGLTLSSAGVLSGTPTQTGTFPITVKATDSNTCFGTGATYSLVISCPTIAVTNPGTATGVQGTAFSQTFTRTGGVGSVTFTTASTLPTGLTLSTAGVLSGTPTQNGTFPTVVVVTDSSSCTGTGTTYSLVINAPPPTVTANTAIIASSATSLVITGTNFSTTAGNNTVAFTPAGTGTVTTATATSLTVTSITGLTNGALNAVVTTTNGGSSGAAVQVATVLPPVTISSLTRVTSTPTNAASVSWTLTFSSATTGLTTSHLALTGAAATGSSLGTPTTANSGLTWTIPVTTGSTDGALIPRVVNDTSLSAVITTALPFDGDTITVDKTPPTVLSVTRLTPSAQTTGLTSLIFRVTYSEPVSITAPETGRYTVVPINGSTVVASVTGVSGTGATRDVTVTITEGSGEFRLRVQD